MQNKRFHDLPLIDELKIFFNLHIGKIVFLDPIMVFAFLLV
ncbi:hypothetical protein PROVRUST_06201 [Providencia rustigianii DSM 4541]|uniref:Uncharacterized protein n=1 Tax=Providencia rustigianii DSM 4541 TaxID=500637 RepID=D1P1X7_9GAMM|nr:hypothetical protein PROVRUST_06201 [Providencia rustigianii DSM 4541]